jgi:hypothetical protein
MKTLTKEDIFKSFGNDFACRVWYKGKKDYIKYDSPTHINWKNVTKITIIYSTKKVCFDSDASEHVTRDGASFIVKS